jgi:hypothetical protein
MSTLIKLYWRFLSARSMQVRIYIPNCNTILREVYNFLKNLLSQDIDVGDPSDTNCVKMRPLIQCGVDFIFNVSSYT